MLRIRLLFLLSSLLKTAEKELEDPFGGEESFCSVRLSLMCAAATVSLWLREEEGLTLYMVKVRWIYGTKKSTLIL